jgi:hypothetical protein
VSDTGVYVRPPFSPARANQMNFGWTAYLNATIRTVTMGNRSTIRDLGEECDFLCNNDIHAVGPFLVNMQ